MQDNDALTSVSAGSLTSVGYDFYFYVSESCRYGIYWCYGNFEYFLFIVSCNCSIRSSLSL